MKRLKEKKNRAKGSTEVRPDKKHWFIDRNLLHYKQTFILFYVREKELDFFKNELNWIVFT